MRALSRVGRALFFVSALGLSFGVAARTGPGTLWRGFEPALAVTSAPRRAPYDLTRLEAVNETLKTIRRKYVDPDRIRPKQMLLSALNYIQRDVAQVIVQHDEPDRVRVTVERESKTFRVDDVLGPWDVAARLREIFAFLQKNLEGSSVDLRELEYAACNGMLHTLDPHSVFLSPEAYREMNVQTSGAFGGLGIVISVRDQQLTVMRPMPETPAQRSGIRRFDRIVKIENESTLNMPLDDAVRRLRGDPGSKVTLWVVREGTDGWSEPRAFPLVREVIKVASVESRPLEGGVGYVRIKNFQATTTDETQSALERLKLAPGGLKGLVVDLRGNPGGLLDQAVKVADLFVEQGPLVVTVGASEGREERRAQEGGTEPTYPIVVLVNGQSASASEILAGALKNHDRAIVVGQQTFGKGSVQLVFPDVTPEKAALKLTIAQYLTPGDVSIQGVGVVPDIELDPMTVDPLEMDLTVQKDGVRERELFASLENRAAAQPSKPAQKVRYQFRSVDRERLRELGADAEDDALTDFPVRFARELVASSPAGKPRGEQLRAAASMLARTESDELKKVSDELMALGVDWASAGDPAKTARASDLEVRVETSKPDGIVSAGESMDLRVTVRNRGEHPVHRLRAQTESESGYFDAKELVFGKIAPGEEKTATVPLGWCEVEGRKVPSTRPLAADARKVCRVPLDAVDRSDGVTVRFEADGEAPVAAETRPTVKALPRPLFRYGYQVVDDRGGNGDGKIQRGERVSVYLTVKNVGAGPSHETQANLSNLSGDGLLLQKGRFDLPPLQPGESRDVAFSFDVSAQLSEPEAVVLLSVGDRDVNEFAREKIKVPVEPADTVQAVEQIRAAGASGATLLEAPTDGARGFGFVASGTPLQVLGRLGRFEKVRIDGSRYAFVASQQLADAPSNARISAPLVFEALYTHAPPELSIQASTLATREPTVRVRGTATGSTKLDDVFALAGGRKVFYRSNKASADPKSTTFEIDVPLKPGVNFIHVVARESPDSVTRRVLVVRRDGPNGALLETPKNDDEEWLGAVDLDEP